MSELSLPSGTPRTTRPGDIFLKRRLKSLDIYRGLIMITLAFAGFGLAGTAKRAQQENATTTIGQGEMTWTVPWRAVEYQFTHVEWTHYAFWDMIQPSFMFMVGASVAFSFASRKRRGETGGKMFWHAVWRSVVLVLLGIFLISNNRESTNWSLMNVLTQIGLGYTFLFLLWRRGFLIQSIVALVLLGGTFAAYRFAPDVGVPEKPEDPSELVAYEQELAEIGLTAEWVDTNLDGIDPWWHKNANVGHHIDVYILNRLPRQEYFHFNAGGYQTINFIPALATMILGLICGEWLKEKENSWGTLGKMLVLGVVCIAAGFALDHFGICPLIKRIWTPSWALFSGGICVGILSVCYLLFDLIPLGPLAYPATVVGRNSLLMYVMYQLMRPWTRNSLATHFTDGIFRLQPEFGRKIFSPYPFDGEIAQSFAIYEPVCQATIVGVCFWLVCYVLHRKRLFVRI